MAYGNSHMVVKIVGLVVVVLLTLPLVVLIGVSLNPGVNQVFPPHGISLRWYYNLANRDGLAAATEVTAYLAAMSALVNVAISTVAGVAIVRYRFWGKDLVLTMLLSPLIVPQVVTGMAFLVTLSALGVFNSLISLSILHVVITLPFSARVVVSALSAASEQLEEAARSLGATPVRAFLHVTIPLIRPGLFAAGMFAFVTSFENFTASQFLVWDHTTLPVELYTYVQTENDPTAAAVSSLIVLTVIVFVIVFNRFMSDYVLSPGTKR